MLYYCPLESYKERYTIQWSAATTGWLERNWIKHKVPYKRIDGQDGILKRPEGIQTGCALDAVTRSMWCFAQVEKLLVLAESGGIKSEDTIYFDDFWHPGIEALAYSFQLWDIHPKMYAFCHAQSVDEFDFTYPMRYWMRDFEKGISQILSGIFVNSQLLKDLLVIAGIGTNQSVHVIGHIFCEEEVRERFPKTLPPKENTVVFCSRWDKEKNPLIFLNVIKEVMKQRQDIHFIVCTSSKNLRSSHQRYLEALKFIIEKYPKNVFLKEGLSKEEYYLELLKAKIQINTASQDWVSIALLEASVAGCYPIYPYYRSFPQALKDNLDFMYLPFNFEAATRKILEVIDKDILWTKEQIALRAWIHQRHNTSWARMINIIMGKPLIGAVEEYA